MIIKNRVTALIHSISSDKAAGQQLILRLLRPALVVACIYVLFIGLDSLIHGHNALYYVHLGPRFTRHDPRAAPGYDGQFYYRLALDPLHATPFLDHPAYRYQRLVYPIIVAVLSLGQANVIPYMLLVVNFIAIVLGTELLARLLITHHLSPWFSLAFGLYFGQATAFLFDTTEPLTYLFICLGLFLLARQRPTVAALCMGLAVLSRETAVLFPLGYLVLYLLQKRWQDVLRLFLLSIAPTIAWYMVIALLFKTSGLSAAPAFERIPFQGLFVFFNDARFRPLIILMLIPTLLSWLLLAKQVVHGHWRSTSWLIWLFNLVLVSWMSRLSYVELVSAGRLSTGLVLAMLFYGWSRRNTTILWACQIYALTFPYYALGILG
ncbi:MAG: AZOBR_p60025 family cell surface glycopolymer formation protein [Ktedonobacteraceae bacterium]